MSDADWAVASRECDYHIRNVRRLIAPDAFWVNDTAAREVVLLKMPQLVAAAQCGFAIPETLYSNDPDEIRRFWSEHREAGVIFKLHLQTHWQAQSSGERHALFTSYAGFLASGAWERGYAEDGESHAKYSPPGLINEP